MGMWLRNHVYKVPPPHLYHSLALSPPSCSLPVPPLIPTLLVSVCTGGIQLLPMAVFPCNWSSPGGFRAPQLLLSKAMSGPRTPGYAGQELT